MAASFLLPVKRAVLYYANGFYQELNRKDIFLFAQAIAFKVFVTIVPVLVLATGILGSALDSEWVSNLLGGERAFDIVARQVRELLPPYQTERTLEFLLNLQSASGTITLIGLIGLLVSAVTLLTTLRAVIANIFSEDYHKNRSIIGGYLFDLRMVGQVGLLFLLSVSLTVAMQWVNRAGSDFFRWYGLDWDWLFESWNNIFQFVGLLLPLLISLAMFSQLFYFVPQPHPPRRSVLRGAATTALLWEAAKYGFTFYAANVARFDLGNTFGLVLAFVFWIYFSGIVLCVGALVVLLDEKRLRNRQMRIQRPVSSRLHRKRRRPAAAATAPVQEENEE